jgi:hypothetical protein
MKTIGGLVPRLSIPSVLAAGIACALSCQAQGTTAATNAASGTRLRTWEMPAITVSGSTNGLLREEELIGPYQQPRWTTQRRFPKVRVYTIPEGEQEIEYWTRVDVPKDSKEPWEVQHFFEYEIGLPYHLQFDTYLVLRNEDGGFDGPTRHDGQFEMRWALDDWGKIFANPTFYLEYVWREATADKIEAKALFGDELAPRWHWGLNLVYEGETSGDCEHEYSATAGLSYTVLDEGLSVGVEAEKAYADAADDRGKFSNDLLVGPSIQVRTSRSTHVNLTPLIGLHGGTAAKIFLNAGWEF